MSQDRARRRRGVILSSQGWQRLRDAIRAAEGQEQYGERFTQEELGDRTQLDPGTVAKILQREKGADKGKLEQFFQAFGLELQPSDHTLPRSDTRNAEPSEGSEVTAQNQVDWGEAVDVSIFYGRAEELATLEQWILGDRCRLVALLGMGGIGKTSLTAKLGEQIQGEFEYVVWRSLREAPPLNEILSGLLQFLSNQHETEAVLPKSMSARIYKLLEYLRNHRCLLILDNAESILQEGKAGVYREGYEAYGELLRRVGESSHQSCVVVTSREKLKELLAMEGDTLPVRCWQMRGVQEVEGQSILEATGLRLTDMETQIAELVQRCGGNPLTLMLIATTIRELFDGNVTEFLKEGAIAFAGVRELLDQHFERLSEVERSVMYWLAINREPVSVQELLDDIVPSVQKPRLLEALKGLVGRSLIEKSSTDFMLQNVVMEYVTNRLIESMSDELKRDELSLFNQYALIKATVKDYVRETQVRLILTTIIENLVDINQRLVSWLQKLREQPNLTTGYTAGNLLNLLCQLNTQIKGYDFSHLTIRQAYLKGMKVQQVTFAHSHFVKPGLTQAFGEIFSVAFSPDGKILATGDRNGDVRIWQVKSRKLLSVYQGHTDWVGAVAFSPDGQTLASSSDDRTVRLWDLKTRQCLHIFRGHTDWVGEVAFSPDGQILASGSDDHTIRLWDLKTRQCLHIFQVHRNRVRSIAFSPDSQTLVSGSSDYTVRLWDLKTRQCLHIFQGHNNWVGAVAFSPDGQILASGSEDKTIRLWDLKTHQCIHVFQGHSNRVRSIAFSSDSQTLVSGSSDSTIRLWDLKTFQCLHIFQEHSNQVYSVAFSLDGKTLASGSDDKTIRLWDIQTRQCLHIFRGHTDWVGGVAFSPDGQTLASSSDDHTIRLWDIQTRQCLHILQGHYSWIWSIAFSSDGKTLASASSDRTVRLWDLKTHQCLHVFKEYSNWVYSVAFSPDGQTLASGSEDKTIRLWDLKTRQCLHIFQEHSNRVYSVAFSPDGQTLASGGDDSTIRLWDLKTRQCLHIFQEHNDRVGSVAFSPDGQTLASGSNDHTIRLWDLKIHQCLHIFQKHSNWVGSVAFSLDGQTLASGSNDHTIRLWDLKTRQCLHIFQEHSDWVGSVTFSPDGQTLASGSKDGLIGLWDIQAGECQSILRAERPYEDMDVTGITGLTEAQKSALMALGAIAVN